MAMTDKSTIVRLREVNGVIYASSRDVAQDFGKPHKHVLRDINALREEIGPSLGQSWFRDDQYFDSYNRAQDCIDMSRQGWELVVMNYRGMVDWKVAYILKFEEMEAKLGPAGARTAALFDRTNPVFQGPAKAQQDLLYDGIDPAEDVPDGYNVDEDEDFDDALARSQWYRTGVNGEPLRREDKIFPVDTWTDRERNIVNHAMRQLDEAGNVIIFQMTRVWSVADHLNDLRAPKLLQMLVVGPHRHSPQVLVRRDSGVSWDVFLRNYLRLPQGPYTPIAIATLRAWWEP